MCSILGITQRKKEVVPMLVVLDQLDWLKDLFYKNKKWFPHIRSDYLKRKVLSGCVYTKYGVAVVFTRYKRKQKIGTAYALANDVCIHQIVATAKGDGSAMKAIQDFFNYVDREVEGCAVFLSVREENGRARGFYEKVGMMEVGFISWKKSTIHGRVYAKIK